MKLTTLLLPLILRTTILFAVLYGITQIASHIEYGYDDTDPPQSGLWSSRSGLTLYTDHLTGCQYLGHGWLGGGLIPRTDAKGNHLGCK